MKANQRGGGAEPEAEKRRRARAAKEVKKEEEEEKCAKSGTRFTTFLFYFLVKFLKMVWSARFDAWM